MALPGKIWRIVHGPEETFEEWLATACPNEDLAELYALCKNHAPGLVARIRAHAREQRVSLEGPPAPRGAAPESQVFMGYGKDPRPAGPPAPANIVK